MASDEIDVMFLAGYNMFNDENVLISKDIKDVLYVKCQSFHERGNKPIYTFDMSMLRGMYTWMNEFLDFDDFIDVSKMPPTLILDPLTSKQTYEINGYVTVADDESRDKQIRTVRRFIVRANGLCDWVYLVIGEMCEDLVFKDELPFVIGGDTFPYGIEGKIVDWDFGWNDRYPTKIGVKFGFKAGIQVMGM